MKKTVTLLLVLMMLLPAFIFAGGAKEPQIVEEVSAVQFEGMIDINRSAWEVGKPGGRLVRTTFGSDPKTFSIITGSETSTTDVTYRMYNYLSRRNQLTLEWEPDLAESWKISADQLSVTVTLRKGLKWSDGTPLTAMDFVWAVNEIYLREGVECNMTSGLYVGDNPSVWEFINDTTLKVTLPEVYAGMLNMLNVPPLPRHIVKPVLDQGGVAAINSFWGVDTDVTKIVGCGPFLLKEYVPGQRIVLRKNPNYYEKDAKGQQLPYLDEVIYLLVEDQDTEMEKFLAGQTDTYILRGEDVAVLMGKKDQLNFDIYNVGAAFSTNFIVFNQNPAKLPAWKSVVFNDRQFRLAMAHLVDRQNIINNLAFGYGYPQYSFVPKASPYYWDGLDAAAPKYDPERAKKILDEAGYVDRNNDGVREDKNGNKLSFVMTTNSGNKIREAIGTAFAEEARRVGVEVIFKPEDFNTMVGRLLSTFDYEIIQIGLTGDVDPISGQNVYPSSGNLHMTHPNQTSPIRDWEKKMDEYWAIANNTTDEAQRARGYELLQKLWIEENPWIHTFNAAIIHAYKRGLGNVKPQSVNGMGWDGVLHRLYWK